MSGTALEHPLVRGYLRDLDTALRGLPAAQALELREQITAHLDDALGPDAGDQPTGRTPWSQPRPGTSCSSAPPPESCSSCC